MTPIKPTDSEPAEVQSQAEKFRELAREIEADEDEAAWDERLKKVVRHKPVEGAPE